MKQNGDAKASPMFVYFLKRDIARLFFRGTRHY